MPTMSNCLKTQSYMQSQFLIYHNNMNQLTYRETTTSQILNQKFSQICLFLNQFSLELNPTLGDHQENFLISQLDTQIVFSLSNIYYVYRTLLLKMNLTIIKIPQPCPSLGFSTKHPNSEMGKFQNCAFINANYSDNRKKRFISRQKNRGPYRSYTREEKNHVVNLHNDGMNFASISKQLKIPQKNVVRWCREGLTQLDSNRRLADSGMERKLSAWLLQHPNQQNLAYSNIQEKALEFSSNCHFKASRGWLKNFLKRYDTKIADLLLKDEQESIKYQEA